MQFTKLITKTIRTDPSEAETPSHRYMLKSGMIYQVASGIYTYLPLAWRSLRKIEAIIRQEMDAAGGQEIRMPVLQPIELWNESGRSTTFGENLFTLKDRRDRTMVMAPTHEEVVSYLAKTYIQSYRDLPRIPYQIQTKFRDEPRSRAGLIRVREFDMKDAYSLDADEKGLDASYKAMAHAYRNIYKRCGLPALMVEADSGAIGGKDSHEFILAANTGEDTVIICEGCNYAANLEKATGVKNHGPYETPLPMEEIDTPNIKTIKDLSGFINVPETKILKSVIYWANGEIIMVTIRGDLDINEVKLRNHFNSPDLRLATEQEIDSAGLPTGYVSPVGLEGIKKIADDSVRSNTNYVVGANKPHLHLIHVNYPRDFDMDAVLDIAQAKPGQACPNCGRSLKSTRGIEVGHIFKLGTFYSDTMGITYLNQEGQQQPVIMGCYGIGIGRLLAAAIEQNHDEKGMIFPMPIAPYQVHLVGLNLSDEQVAEASNTLYEQLWNAGIECLFDDRTDETAGVKFNDADLLGLPIRLVISKRALKTDSVELLKRGEKDTVMVPINHAVPTLVDMITSDTC